MFSYQTTPDFAVLETLVDVLTVDEVAAINFK